MSYISITAHPAIELPLPPQNEGRFEMDVYARFFRHLRCVPNSRAEIKVLSSIQFTADMMGTSDEHVAKVLVDAGLRAPRMAFPESFLNHVDQSFTKESHEIGAAGDAYKALASHWRSNGENPFPLAYRTYNLPLQEKEVEHV